MNLSNHLSSWNVVFSKKNTEMYGFDIFVKRFNKKYGRVVAANQLAFLKILLVMLINWFRVRFTNDISFGPSAS